MMMKKFKTPILCLLACVLLMSVALVAVTAASAPPRETNAFVADHYTDPINQSAPFFDKVLPEIEKNIAKYNKKSVTPVYDKMPKANNPENFQGLGSTTYANINGKTVTAEAFYRVTGEALHDPNCGMGLLIYQSIQYKRAHPEEDVKITFSSYRMSVTASVCVIPESKYYGYMRSLFGTNYDEQGFVRISYMLSEAARMGIEVTIVTQLDSYGVWQYDPATGKNRSRSNLDHRLYYQQALESDCYNAYAPGKKVSDFLTFAPVDWTVDDKTSDMQHVKSAAVSHYLATDGSKHKNAVFFSSANLDENSYKGCNGNNGTQSGVIVSDHADLFRVTYNYTKLMAQYADLEGMFPLRKLVNERNNEQMALYLAGRGDEIPKNEQILYVGGEDDPVFELYFTPFGGAADSWDTVNSPFCKYIDKLPKSRDYVEFVWNEFGYGQCYTGEVLEKMIQKAFCENKNPNNRFAIRVTDFDTAAIEKLKLGKEIGYRSIKDGTNIHAKDMLMSYEENGVRHRVSLMTSCNFYMIAFNYRTNSLLVINETEQSGGNFYSVLGKKYSYGMMDNDMVPSATDITLQVGQSRKISVSYGGSKALSWSSANASIASVSGGTIKGVAPGTTTVTVSNGSKKVSIKVTVVTCMDCGSGTGITCDVNGQYTQKKVLTTAPRSFEATFSVNKSQLTGSTTLMGSDGLFDPAISFGMNKNGNPRVVVRSSKNYKDGAVYVFDKVDVATGKTVHLGITIDTAAKKLRCYVNGDLVQTISGISSFSGFAQKHAMVVGGDHRNGNATFFPGALKSVAIWSDLRSGNEVATDWANGLDLADTALLGAYDLTRCDKHMAQDMSKTDNDLVYSALWQDKSEVTVPTDYAYSFAVVGDTQTMCEWDPDAMEGIYDWILANKEDHKIEYVIGLGDITDDSTGPEWDYANRFIGKLDGKIPYVLTRGNHDDWDDFNRHLHNGFYEKTVDGMMVPGPVDLQKEEQPGVVDGITAEEDEPEGGIVQGDLTNSYRYFNVQGTDYLILTLDFAPNEEMLAWANSVIEAHPDHRVIAITHAYMYRDGTTLDAGDCYPPSYYKGYTNAQNGDQMWEKCFSKHENVVLVLSGHDPWQHIAYRQDKGVKGNTVTQMLIDAQYVDRNIGSTGMVAMFYFSNDGDTLTVRYYSVTKDCYGSPVSQFTVDLR